jgi:hypothetical protein
MDLYPFCEGYPEWEAMMISGPYLEEIRGVGSRASYRGRNGDWR